MRKSAGTQSFHGKIFDMKRFAQRTLVACALIWLPAAAQAQPFPTGPISLVVPLAPGDAADIAARALGEEISRLLKTPVLAINRPGAGGAVGTNAVVQARKTVTRFCLRKTARLPFVPFSTRNQSPTMRSGIWRHSAPPHARRPSSSCAATHRTETSQSSSNTRRKIRVMCALVTLAPAQSVTSACN